jgi:hypothetical protein
VEGSHAAADTAAPKYSLSFHVSDQHSVFVRHTKMSGCTLRFARNSPLRTTLVDEATGDVKYKIETPIRIARSVTRIRKFKPHTPASLHLDVDLNSESGDDIGDREEVGSGTDTEPQETSEEIARIYWKWFSSNRFIFRGRITTRSEFLPKCGKMKG